MKKEIRPNYREERSNYETYVKSKKPALFFPFQIAFEKLFNGAANLKKYINGN